MGLLSLFSKPKNQNVGLGIDIGTVALKVAQVSKTGNGYSLTNYAILELANRSDALNNALQSSTLHPLTKDLGVFLGEIKKTAQLETNVANLSLPAFIAQTALIDIPMSGKSEHAMENAIMAAASAYLPLPITETTIKWIPIGDVKYPDGTTHKKILFIAIPTERVNQYADIAKAAGFSVADVELESISVARALSQTTKEPTLIVDIGGRSSTCTAVKNGVVYVLSQTDFSSDSFTQTVSQALAISLPRAEILKRQSVIASTAGGHELSTIIAPVIGAILSEVGRVISNFQSIAGEPIKQIIICGAGAQLKGLDSYIAEQTKLPTLFASALGSTVAYPPELTQLAPELNAHLTVAVGLALKSLV